MFVCVGVCFYMFLCVSVCAYMFVWVCKCFYMFVCVSVCVCVHVCRPEAFWFVGPRPPTPCGVATMPCVKSAGEKVKKMFSVKKTLDWRHHEQKRS